MLLALGLLAAAHALQPPERAQAAGHPNRPAARWAAPPADLGSGARIELHGLAPGACIAFAPTSGNRRLTVFLDPGHGGPDPGAVGAVAGRQLAEKDLALAVAIETASALRAQGLRVVMSRIADQAVASLTDADLDAGALRPAAERRDLLARVDCANAAGAAVLLAIHFNGYDDPEVGGSQTFYDAGRPFSARSRLLAGRVQQAAVAALGTADRGATADLEAASLTEAGADYGHLLELGPAREGWLAQPSRMPGALVEPLFISNPAEAALAASDAGRHRLALALAGALVDFLAPN